MKTNHSQDFKPGKTVSKFFWDFNLPSCLDECGYYSMFFTIPLNLCFCAKTKKYSLVKVEFLHDKFFLALRSYTWLNMVVMNPKCPGMFRQAWIRLLFFFLSLYCFDQCRCLHGNDVFLHQNHKVIENIFVKKKLLRQTFDNIYKLFEKYL